MLVCRVVILPAPSSASYVPSKLTSTGINKYCPVVVSISLSSPPMATLPATILFVSRFSPPTDSLSARNVAIARCVGIILLLSALKVPSVLNSLITVPDPPSLTPPSAS